MEPKTAQGSNDAKAKEFIDNAVAQAVAPMVKSIETMAASVAAFVEQAKAQVAAKATSHMAGVGDTASGVEVGDHASKGTGIGAVRVLKAGLTLRLKGAAAINAGELLSTLRGQGYGHDANVVERALSQSLFTDGGALIPQQYVAELVALLRNQTAVRQMGARSIPMGPSMEWPEQTGAASAFWVGENTTITDSQPALGTQKMSEKKLAALVAFSNDLIRNASIPAEEFIRQDLLAVLALKEDVTALFSDGGAYAPRGITSFTKSANQVNSTAASQIAPTLAEIRQELGKCVERLMTGNIPMQALGWIMAPRTWRYLWSITDGNGNAVYQQEMNSGKLLGFPFKVTNQIPINQTWGVDGSVDVSSLIFGDFAQFIIGESMGTSIELFPNAAFSTGGNVISGVSTDRSVIRAIMKEDFLVRYSGAFTIVKTRMGA